MKKHFMVMLVWGLSGVLLFSSSVLSREKGINRLKQNNRENRLALVIGNADYKNIKPLKNSVNDARDIADALKQVGFEVILKENSGYREMEEAVYEFGKQLTRKRGVGLFYFSGHGVQFEGQNYLIPVDVRDGGKSELKYKTVDAGMVLGKMEESENIVNIIILDACRTNPFKEVSKSLDAGSRGLAAMDGPAGSIIVYATSPDKTASDGDPNERNGVYARYLLKHIKTPGLKIEEVLKNTRVDVVAKTVGKQTPWENSSLMGDFYFVDSGGAVISQPATKKESSLLVRPNVSDATVWINDKKMGTGTLSFKQIQPGLYRIKVEKDGYLPYQTETEIEEGEAKEVPVYLAKPEPKPEPIPAPVPVAKPKLEPIPAPVSAGKKITNSLGMEFVYIPPGTFMMGSPENEPGRSNDEKQHRVTLTKGFYMQTTEVTQGQWKAVMGNNPSYFKNCGDNCPVENVSWDDVQIFIEKLNRKEGKSYRLPTEAEWEYTCRAGTQTAYNWGDSADCFKANYRSGKVHYRISEECKGKNPQKTKPSASFAPNAWGLYDMHGNVWEWCQDRYDDYPTGYLTDPAGPDRGSNRVERGGGWYDSAEDCRSADRSAYTPDNRFNDVGFRLALSPGQQR